MKKVTPNAVKAVNVRKRYGEKTEFVDALLGVDLTLSLGETVSILGPNGAGKTTFIEILEGLRKADSGEITLFGKDITNAKTLKAMREYIGIAPQHTVLPDLLTVEELLDQQAAFYVKSLPVDYLIERLGLDEKRDTRIGHLSGGQQQRVTIALALIGDPELIFLDEPTSQLDPQAKRAVWALLAEHRQRKSVSILMTTHQMEEAQEFSNRVCILDHGQIIANDTPQGLIDTYTPSRIVEFITDASADLAFLSPCIEGDIDVVEQPMHKRRITLKTGQPNDVVMQLVNQNQSTGLLVDDIRVESQSLEDVFINITGRRMRS